MASQSGDLLSAPSQHPHPPGPCPPHLFHLPSMRRRAPQAAPPNQPLYPTARPPPPTAAMAATSPYSAAGGFAQAPLAGGSLYPTRVAQQQYGLNSSIDGRDDYGSSGAEGSKDWQQTALLHGRWALRGWRDAARPARVFEMISRSVPFPCQVGLMVKGRDNSG